MADKQFKRRMWIDENDTVQDWVPGRPADLDTLIEKVAGAAAHFGEGAEKLRTLNTDPWQGEAAEAFRGAVKRLPKELDGAVDAFVEAGLAVLAYKDVLVAAQRLTQHILEHEAPRARELARAYATSVSEYYTAVKSGDTGGVTKPPETDPGKTAMEELCGRITAAQGNVEEAASAAKSRLGKAAEKAPKKPTGWQKFASGAKAAGTDMLDFAMEVNPARLLLEPDAYVHDGAMVLDSGVTAVRHPADFAVTFGEGIDNTWDAFQKDPVRMLGYLGTSAALGGAASYGRTALARKMDVPNALGRETGLGTGGDHLDSNGPAAHSQSGNRASSDPTDPVDLATGKMYLPQTDVTLPGTLPLVFRRRVESGYRAGRWFGPSWSSTADQRLEFDRDRVVFVTEDGLVLAYPRPQGNEEVLPSHGPRWPLRAVAGGEWTVTDRRAGWVRHFAERDESYALLEQLDDRNGNWITFEYDGEGAPTALTHSGGYRVRVTTEAHRITALHLAGAGPEGTDAELIRYGYSEAGDLTEVVGSSGLPLRFSYDEAGRITSWTDTNDRGYTYEYDDRDRCVAEGGTEGHMRLRLAYGDPDPETGLRTTTATTGAGHVHGYLVNDLCQVVAETDPLGAVTHFRRDRYNRLLSRTDPLGQVTTYEYDEAGDLTGVVRPDGGRASAEYDELGLPVRVVDPAGSYVTQTYDERGNRTSMTDAAGATTRFAYDEGGRATAVTDALGNVTRVEYDGAGLPVRVTDPLGASTRYERDSFGRPVSITDALGAVTHLAWTVEGRLTRRTAPDGTSESWTYDGEGNCTGHTDPMGAVSRFEYTHFDLLTARTGPDGVRYEFEHDAELRLTRVRNPQGLTWEYEYDAAGRLLAETDFDDREVTYGYDAAGHLASRGNALGQVVSFGRDALGQVVRKDAAGQVTSYAYDAAGRLTGVTGPDAAVELRRDDAGRLLSETVEGRELSYTYDVLGRRTTRRTPAGAVTTWSYDAAGRHAGMTASGRALDFTYDAVGRELTRVVGSAITLEHAFDAAGRLTTQSVTASPGDRPVQHRTYTYRADGNLTGIDDALSGARRFDLDAAGRVTAVRAADWTETYAYDEAGNQVAASWPADHPGQEAVGPRAYTGTRITRAGRVRYEHDALGRVVVRQRTRLSRKPDTWRYEWDAEDRLTSVTTPDGTRWRYTYDPLGRRTAKLRLAPDGETVTERVDFTWDGTTLCEQTTWSEFLPHPVTLTWDHQGLRPITQTERITSADAPQSEIDSRFFAIVTDLVGTPSELVDERGEIAWRTRSTLWGITAWATDSTAYTPLRFPGQYFDPETGLHYNFARYYDPDTARYCTPDPLGLAPAPNPVTYIRNPYTKFDHLGLAPDACPREGEILYRGDMRSPDTLRASGGFISAAPGSDVSLYDYVVNHTPSDHISTSRSSASALLFTRPGGYLYELESPAGGIDVNTELGPLHPTPYEKEIAFRREIPFGRILRAWEIDDFWEIDDELLVYTRDS
ncbi:DUF6531 domain-containing protein [Streptomyces sp. NPDC059786]|uniref:DUF6531 domain-containing protein n=1 Tax=Streptomyces sp. NPDC059786 TaxID=3346946 RepID=UPI00364F09A9